MHTVAWKKWELDQFPIPMRGNELVSMANPKPVHALVSDPHEG